MRKTANGKIVRFIALLAVGFTIAISSLDRD